MLAIRILGLIAVTCVGASLAMFVWTRNRRYLRFGWQVLKVSGILVLVLLGILALERI